VWSKIGYSPCPWAGGVHLKAAVVEVFFSFWWVFETVKAEIAEVFTFWMEPTACTQEFWGIGYIEFDSIFSEPIQGIMYQPL
jgi:hypothetical protein